MTFWRYIKEKWYMFVLAFLSILFSISVYYLSNKMEQITSDGVYIFAGLILFFVIYILIDYFIIKARVNKIISYIKNGAEEEIDSFYPTDMSYFREINKLAGEYNHYRSKAATEYSKDLEFVTKWVHDVKVPISAMKLLLESDEDGSKERLEMELLAIEQSTQKVLYNIKSKSFYDDYKIANAGTKKIISTSLKQFATFFSYKKINLKITGNDYNVLTDSKWSGYIITQFISNAIKHTKEGGEIEIATVRKNSSTLISVRNTGAGFEESDAKSIFNRGYSAAERLGAYSTGYGLYLSKKLADKLGHRLLAESKRGIYAKFSIIFFDHDSF